MSYESELEEKVREATLFRNYFINSCEESKQSLGNLIDNLEKDKHDGDLQEQVTSNELILVSNELLLQLKNIEWMGKGLTLLLETVYYRNGYIDLKMDNIFTELKKISEIGEVKGDIQENNEAIDKLTDLLNEHKKLLNKRKKLRANNEGVDYIG